MTPGGPESYLPTPHWGTPEEGNLAREGRGETRPRTERAREDRSTVARGAQHDDAGSGPRRQPRAHPQEGCLSRQREPLPTRVEDLAPLSAAYADALEGGLAELDLQLEPDVRATIDGHVKLLLAWTGAINLTSIRDPAEVARLHVLDSLTAVAERALLVESIRKKAGFLDVAVQALGLATRVAVVADRAEAVARDPRDRERWPAVLARAVAALPELVELAFPLLLPGGVLVAWKRGAIESEVSTSEALLGSVGGGRIEVVASGLSSLPDHLLVVVEKTGRTADSWPRDPAVRRRPC